MTFPTEDHIAAAQEAADRLWTSQGFYCWPSASLAQTIIESDHGKKVSGRNNYHGIKATPAQVAAGEFTECSTREVIGGKSVYIMDKFANFASLADSYEQHARLFVRAKNHDGSLIYADGVKAKNAVDFIRAIAPHYATAEKDPDPAKRYSTIVIGIMTGQQLYQYDKPVSARGAPPAAVPSKQGEPTMVDTPATADTPRVTPTVSMPVRTGWISWIEQFLAHEQPFIAAAVNAGLEAVEGSIPGGMFLKLFVGQKIVDELIAQGIKALDALLEKAPELSLGSGPIATYVTHAIEEQAPLLFAALGPKLDELIAAGLAKIGVKAS